MRVKLKCTLITGQPGVNQKTYNAGDVIDITKAEATKLIDGQDAVVFSSAVDPEVKKVS